MSMKKLRLDSRNFSRFLRSLHTFYCLIPVSLSPISLLLRQDHWQVCALTMCVQFEVMRDHGMHISRDALLTMLKVNLSVCNAGSLEDQ